MNSLPFGGVVAEFLMKSRYVKPGILQKIFLSVLGASAVKGEKDRYNCPWYLCISTPNADSNQIIGELKDYDDSLKDITFDEINNLTCHVLHDAVLFNLTKEMIQERFETILDLMRVYKPMRPVEGAIIFANPIDMIDTKGLGIYTTKNAEFFLTGYECSSLCCFTNCENIKGFEGIKVFETGQEIFGYSALSQDKLECDFKLLDDMEHGICDDIAKRTILDLSKHNKSIKKSIIFKKNFNDFFKHISAFMKLFLNSGRPINFKGYI